MFQAFPLPSPPFWVTQATFSWCTSAELGIFSRTWNRFLESVLQKHLLSQVPSQIWDIFLSGTLLSCCGIQPGDAGTINGDFLIPACPVTSSKMELSGSSSPAVITYPHGTGLPQCCFLLRYNCSAGEGALEWEQSEQSSTLFSLDTLIPLALGFACFGLGHQALSYRCFTPGCPCTHQS